ncbi:hypothetical protein M0813_08314 [Anaeramoeba flamelloides]|uniref:Uncharacterized protein n=1 Tax=Anaeramoeba flamelloides TaxID=1746091 RepID=A0ABQ8X8F7_9EUKA|nr:hypothetical protein M0813_08314 [Anaeramoeba flamelloides]
MEWINFENFNKWLDNRPPDEWELLNEEEFDVGFEDQTNMKFQKNGRKRSLSESSDQSLDSQDSNELIDQYPNFLIDTLQAIDGYSKNGTLTSNINNIFGFQMRSIESNLKSSNDDDHQIKIAKVENYIRCNSKKGSRVLKKKISPNERKNSHPRNPLKNKKKIVVMKYNTPDNKSVLDPESYSGSLICKKTPIKNKSQSKKRNRKFKTSGKIISIEEKGLNGILLKVPKRMKKKNRIQPLPLKTDYQKIGSKDLLVNFLKQFKILSKQIISNKLFVLVNSAIYQLEICLKIKSKNILIQETSPLNIGNNFTLTRDDNILKNNDLMDTNIKQLKRNNTSLVKRNAPLIDTQQIKKNQKAERNEKIVTNVCELVIKDDPIFYGSLSVNSNFERRRTSSITSVMRGLGLIRDIPSSNKLSSKKSTELRKLIYFRKQSLAILSEPEKYFNYYSLLLSLKYDLKKYLIRELNSLEKFTNLHRKKIIQLKNILEKNLKQRQLDQRKNTAPKKNPNNNHFELALNFLDENNNHQNNFISTDDNPFEIPYLFFEK